jgi:short-subunit dehydrogenase
MQIILTAIGSAIFAFILHRFLFHERTTLDGPKRSDDRAPRRILITGAASNVGIGRETVKLFVEGGWEVGVTDKDEAEVKELAKEFRCKFAKKLDVTNPDECQSVVKEFCSKTNDLDALFNCAGVLALGMFSEMDLARQTKQVRVNCEGVVNMTYAALPYLKKRPKGEARIVTMASATAVHGFPQMAVYSASKAFVYRLTEALAIEFEPDQIYVGDVSVMFVDTPMVTKQEHRFNSLLARYQPRIYPKDVACRVWDAFHQVRPQREHFYVWKSLSLAFKVDNFLRAFGLRFMSRTISLVNMPA